MATDNPKATAYLEPANYEALVEYADSKGITLKHKEGKAIVSSSLLNMVLSDLFVGDKKKCATSDTLNDTLAELQNRISALEEFQQRMEGPEEDSSYSLGTDSFDSPDGRTHSYEALFDKIEKALLSELKQGKQSPTAKRVHKIMDQFRQEYP